MVACPPPVMFGSTGIAAPVKKFSSLMDFGLIVVCHVDVDGLYVVVLGDAAAGSKITVPFGIGYETPFNTNNTPVNMTFVITLVGMPFGLNCAFTQTTGTVPT